MKSCGQAFLILLFIFATILPSPAQKHEQTSVDVSANVSTKDLLRAPGRRKLDVLQRGLHRTAIQQFAARSILKMSRNCARRGFSILAIHYRLEATPLVVNGVMYVTSANDAFALDARTGRTLWHHHRPVSSGLLDDAAGHQNRGVALWRHFVYMETDDAHLLCLDARSGNLLWDVEYADKTKHYGATSAPLIVKDEVIVGTSGGDSGVRGFLAAYDAMTGNLKWRFWTIPAPGEFGSESWPGDSYLHGGATTWMPGTYDPELDTLYWTTSNAAPDFEGSSRPGDNLYTACCPGARS